MSEDEQRKLAAIMFTDMVGYSALSQRDDKLALELLEEHRQLLREIFPRFHGSEIKTIGDAFLVEFNSALEAAQCAIAIQRALAKRNADAPAERQIEVRIGIHIGDVVHRAGDVYGDGVNIASRIEQLANAGGVCVSMDVERQIRNALETRFEKLAPTKLKNISVPMDLFRIVLPWEQRKQERPTVSSRSERAFPISRIGWIAAIAVALVGVSLLTFYLLRSGNVRQTRTAGGISIPEKSIAVLPFENLSGNPENAYFTEGIQEEILTRLAKIADLKVISRTSTQHFKSSPDNLPQIAQQLGVANILEGSVQRAADQVHVNVQLIRAATDAHLWAEAYDRKLTDIFAAEADIAKIIAETLQAKLTGAEQRAIAKRPTENPEAHELYLKGRFFWNKRTAADLRKAIDYFNQALTKDPGYALAYAGLSDAYGNLPYYGGGSPADSFPRANAAAQNAIKLDDTSAEAHTALASGVVDSDLDFQQSLNEFERAIQLNPNYATAHQWYSIVLLALGAFDRAIAEAKRAVELDPLSLVINSSLSWDYFLARRYDEAITQARKTIEMDPRFYDAHEILGMPLQLKGQVNEAIAEYRKAVELSDDDPYAVGLLGQACARAGQREEAQKILARLTEEATSRYVPPYSFALMYLALGDKERAIDEMERGYRERAGVDVWLIKVDPMLDDLRGNPRFEALAEKIVPAQLFQKAVAGK